MIIYMMIVPYVCGATSIHQYMTTSKGYVQETLDILGLDSHFSGFIASIESEGRSSFGNFESNATGRVYVQKYWEIYAALRAAAEGSSMHLEWKGKELDILDFISEFERTVDGRDQTAGEAVCHELGLRLSRDYGLSFSGATWQQQCFDMSEYPLKVYHRNMSMQVMKMGVMIIGIFSAMVMCILRSLMVIENIDSEERKERKGMYGDIEKRQEDRRRKLEGNRGERESYQGERQRDEVYEYRREEIGSEPMGWGVFV